VSVSDSDIAFASDLFAALGKISSRRMMGGASLYCNGQIFACLDREATLYLKASGEFAKQMQAAGARQFSSVGKDGKTHNMGYWTIPEAALDEADMASQWAQNALENLK